MNNADYWKKRQKKLEEQLEKSEKALNEKLKKEYDYQLAQISREIGAYYSKYGADGVIQYRTLLERLSEADRRLLMENMGAFAQKYPEYAYLMPIRESIYKLNRLEGLQQEIYIRQCEIGAITEIMLHKHLKDLASRAYKAAGGRNLLNSEVMEKIINKRWVNGENFSDRVWKNTDKVANYMQNDFKNAVIRGDAYERCIKELTRRFGVSYTAARRLIYTEGTFVMNEASMTAFEEFYDEYIYMAHLDERTSKICRSLNGQKFKISEREAGVNFPPMHANCRSTYNIVIPENWVESISERIPANPNKNDRITYNLEKTDEKLYTVKPNIDDKKEYFVGGNVLNLLTYGVDNLSSNIRISSELRNLKSKFAKTIINDFKQGASTLGIPVDEIPTIVFCAHGEMNMSSIASYNIVHNIIRINTPIDGGKQIPELLKKEGVWTATHELIHFLDSNRYRMKNKIVGDMTNKQLGEFNRKTIKKAKTELDKLTKKGYNVEKISDYARKTFQNRKYDETYTEYRTKEALEGRKIKCMRY